MQHRNNVIRARQIIEARAINPETAAHAEQVVASHLLGPSTIARDTEVRPTAHPDHRDASPMAATEAFARELQKVLTVLAERIDIKPPKPGKYDPLFSTPMLFGEVWRARQMVDECGIPYEFYCMRAVEFYWVGLGGDRMPRPSRLVQPDISAYVMSQWAARQQDAAQRPVDVPDAPVASTSESLMG